jgi:riboflavin kinase
MKLGIPTANIPVPEDWPAGIKSGIYFGYARLTPPGSSEEVTYRQVLSIGTNPYFKKDSESENPPDESKLTKNERYTFEVHLLHDFKGKLFYGEDLQVLVMGYIRDERGDYTGLDELIEDIKFDIVVAENSLDRQEWKVFAGKPWA